MVMGLIKIREFTAETKPNIQIIPGVTPEVTKLRICEGVESLLTLRNVLNF